jgi:hypothetical protein
VVAVSRDVKVGLRADLTGTVTAAVTEGVGFDRGRDGGMRRRDDSSRGVAAVHREMEARLRGKEEQKKGVSLLCLSKRAEGAAMHVVASAGNDVLLLLELRKKAGCQHRARKKQERKDAPYPPSSA